MYITLWLVIAEPLTRYWVAKLEISLMPGVTMSTFEPVTGVMIKIVIEKSVRKHVLSTPSKLHFCRNYLVVFCPLSLLS